ncbi:hypothetical protein CLOLEP_00504 [[Clostridium] leptum DSM 753]|uniref:Uncharacterized protein n=1 Tax=[Clostridium] leptum DSM 753 TaxID=428125 RepID=A7VPM8_9FIRM|nr:hypothetical protein CLOLEP_00504 [[Clostridium] leptum DSM 753]
MKFYFSKNSTINKKHLINSLNTRKMNNLIYKHVI